MIVILTALSILLTHVQKVALKQMGKYSLALF